MAKVFIPAQLFELTNGVDQLEIEAVSVGEIVKELEARFPGIRARLCNGDQLSPHLQVSINDTISTRGLITPVEANSEVHFLPAIGGG